jgi:hypothetical protein
LRAHPNLYEINTWAWLEEISAREGRLVRLASVPDTEWDALAAYGFDAIWLMGIWKRSAESRRIAQSLPELHPGFDRALPGWKPDDVVGSPYSVAAYVPDARLGTWADLDAVREKLRARGMALFLDFVGNHTARDHEWVLAHPEFYVQGTREDFASDPASFCQVETGKGPVYLALARDPYFPPWTDVLQLNYFSPAMRAAQIAELETIARHCDGVRCDMAMLQLNEVFARVWGRLLGEARAPATEFWAEARKGLPKLSLLAEVYWGLEQRMLDLGFSYVYDKELYDALRDGDIRVARERAMANVKFQQSTARFLENHDENRCAAVFGAGRLAAAATLLATLPGMRLYHQGELEGRKVFLPIALRTQAPEAPDPKFVEFFANLLRITKDDAFHRGTWNALTVLPEGDDTSGNLIVYEWRTADAWKVVVANLAGCSSQARVSFSGRPLPANRYLFRDDLDGARYDRDADELRHKGLFVRKDAYGAHLFDVTPL